MKENKKVFYFVLLSVLPFIGFSQQKGIQFEDGLTWNQIKAKAKSENKYILADCFATWCGPCRTMDKDVYPNDTVGEYINANFISIKVQMDTSKLDDFEIKKWYADAHAFEQEYHIEAFPTYLFFSPEGNIVHKSVGYNTVSGFIRLGEDALNPKKQVYILLENYKKGQREFSGMASLARSTYELGYKKLAFQIADDYIDNYLIHLNKSLLYTKENIGFMRDFSTSSKDRGFQMMYLHPKEVDEIMGDSMYSQPFVDYIISKEEINPAVISASKANLISPDWVALISTITRKYSKTYADRNVTGARVRWYGWKKNWPEYTKTSVQFIEMRWPKVKNSELNSYAWDIIFRYSTDKKEIGSAIKWMKKVVETESDSTTLLPAFMDTYANLLYKYGRKEEAIVIEVKALAIANEFKEPNYPEVFKTALEKMKKNEPTWIIPDNTQKN